MKKQEESRQYKWDLHVHTSIGSPCAFYDPYDIPRYASGEGLDGVVITDHNFGWAENEIDVHRYDELIVAGKAEGIRILIGMEVSFRDGDLLIFAPDITSFVDALGKDLHRMDFEIEEVFSIGKKTGALLALAHPHSYPDMVPHAIERFNGSRGVFYNPYSIPEIGGSDAHFPWGVGWAYTIFFEEIHDMSDIIHQIERGKCRPTRKRDAGRVQDIV
jgi:hypothetical protein